LCHILKRSQESEGRSSGVQEFRSSEVQEFRSSGVQKEGRRKKKDRNFSPCLLCLPCFPYLP
jgi:hypothetical protein